MGPTTPQQGQGTDVEGSRHGSLVREPITFPRLVLPPVPTFRTPLTPADELPVQQPLRDEQPPTTWQYPFPQPEPTNTYAVPAPVQPTPIEVVAPTTNAPSPRPDAGELARPADGVVETTEQATSLSKIALGLFLVTAAFLYWASGMAFSAALLGTAGLLVSELAIALSLTAPRGAGRPMPATIAAVAAVLLALLTLKGALHAFSDMAMVASLFVLAAALPTLLLLGAAAFVLRRRSPRSLADDSLRAGTGLRFGVVVALLATGFIAKDSFSAKPDAFLAFALVALVAINALHVLRGTGRANRA